MEKNKQVQTTNSREKLIGFLYVLILFTAATAACCMILFRYNTNFTVFSQKDFVIIKMERVRSFQQMQNKEFIIIDSLCKSINAYNPGVTALYEESDIKYLLNEMKGIYERTPSDERYKVFYHTASLYEMWFIDKKELWSKQENVIWFKANLEQCEIGLQNKKEELRSLKK